MLSETFVWNENPGKFCIYKSGDNNGDLILKPLDKNQRPELKTFRKKETPDLKMAG